jgi:hypothetical protein
LNVSTSVAVAGLDGFDDLPWASSYVTQKWKGRAGLSPRTSTLLFAPAGGHVDRAPAVRPDADPDKVPLRPGRLLEMHSNRGAVVALQRRLQLGDGDRLDKKRGQEPILRL